MKSSRENEFWKNIAHRLGNYQEEPQDDWDKIAGALPPQHNGLTNLSQSSDVVVAVLLAFLLGFQVAQWQFNSLKMGVPQNMHAGLAGEIGPHSKKNSAISDFRTVNDGASQSLDTQTENKNEHTSNDSRKQSDAAVGEDKERVRSVQMEGNAMHSNTDGNRDRREPDNARAEYALGKSSEKKIFNLMDASDKEQKTQPNEGTNEKVRATGGQLLDPGKTVQPDATAKETLVAKKDSLEKQVIVKSDTTSVSAPAKAAAKKRRRKFQPSVFFQVTPSLAYQKIIPSKSDAINIQKLNSPGVVSSERLGWSAEAGFQMQVLPKLEIYTSLSYYQQQQVISYTYATDQTQIVQNPDGSYDVSPGSATREFTYDMRNTGISAGALYFLKGKKLMHKIGGGFFYQKGFRAAKANDSYRNSQSDYFGYQLLYRLEYVLNRRTSIFVQPVFTHSFFASEELDEPFTIKPYRAGAGFGLVYHF